MLGFLDVPCLYKCQIYCSKRLSTTKILSYTQINYIQNLINIIYIHTITLHTSTRYSPTYLRLFIENFVLVLVTIITNMIRNAYKKDKQRNYIKNKVILYIYDYNFSLLKYTNSFKCATSSSTITK